jgi:antitoxin component HigA of HigAB toxin-antitoxin module
MPPKIIRNEDDYRQALSEVERLWDGAPGSDAESELEHWGLLVDAYERVRPGQVDPVEVIRAEDGDERAHPRRHLAAIIGENRATEILSRKRALILPMIRNICAAWEILADILVVGDELARASAR